MSLLRGSSLATITAAAATARAALPMRLILPDCDETFPDFGFILEDADFSRLQE